MGGESHGCTHRQNLAIRPLRGFGFQLWLILEPTGQSRGRCWVLSFINLTAVSHAHWNVFQPTPATVTTVRLSIRLPRVDGSCIRGVFCASPDMNDGTPTDLACTTEPGEAGGTVIAVDTRR